MAIISKTSPLHGARGVVGNVLFRGINGKTVASVYNPPRKRRKISELQQLNRDRFAEATRNSKELLRDIEKYEYYKRKAKKLGVGNAYTAAITDLLRKGRIDDVDTSKFEKKGQVVVRTSKQHLGFRAVTVRVESANGDIITQAKAVRNGHDLWSFKYPGTPPKLADVKLYIEARDGVGNMISYLHQAA